MTMTRDNSGGDPVDDFMYAYTSGTNRLIRVSGSSTQFIYDYNGNLISDVLNHNNTIEYDHRNLITKITRVIVSGTIFEPDVTQYTLYKYDDAGNRIRKIVIQTSLPDPVPIGGNIDNPPTGWTYLRNEFYVRGIDGNTIAEYNSFDMEQYNLYAGADNFGKMDIDGVVNYYMKDHLGSIRAVFDKNKTLISAQDYDAWGYLMEDRQYNSESSEYKFTSKERDNESNYDYFGARYYDSRIARWGTTDPLFEKHINWNPYNYVLANPIRLKDPDGRQVETALGLGVSLIGTASIIVATFAILDIVEDGKYDGGRIRGLEDAIKDLIYGDAYVSSVPTEEIAVTTMESRKTVKIDGMRGQADNIIEHLGKLDNLSPDDPDPNDKRGGWIRDIVKGVKEWVKDFKQAYRKTPGKDIREAFEKEFGKDYINKIEKYIDGLDDLLK